MTAYALSICPSQKTLFQFDLEDKMLGIGRSYDFDVY